MTPFAFRLVEKQKLRFYYGISEKQLIHYIKKARKSKGSTGEILLQQLEIRLDNIVYRLGWATTLFFARQIVNHGHIFVDQKCVTIPSFSCSQGQVVRLKNLPNIREIVKKNVMERERPSIHSHLSLNIESITAVIVRSPVQSEFTLDIKELLVIEYYSNRLLS